MTIGSGSGMRTTRSGIVTSGNVWNPPSTGRDVDAARGVGGTRGVNVGNCVCVGAGPCSVMPLSQAEHTAHATARGSKTTLIQLILIPKESSRLQSCGIAHTYLAAIETGNRQANANLL